MNHPAMKSSSNSKIDMLPKSECIISACRKIFVDYHNLTHSLVWVEYSDILTLNPTKILDFVNNLALINCYQWSLEDACRANYDNISLVGQIKKLIDKSNNRRATRINQINFKINEIFKSNTLVQPNARTIVESPGSIYDRLSILVLKQFHIENKIPLFMENQNSLVQTYDLLSEQIEDLSIEHDNLLADLANATLKMKIYQIVKFYNV